MTFSGPPFSVEGIHKGLGSEQAAAARDVDRQRRRATLDEAELHDLERAEYYGETAAVIEDAAPVASRRRSILDRLLRR